ncbi:acid phosphatase/Vanadium-dependent haloperoxidase [Westerdykella ornata]|uniref:Acid phosphatase/Vanadium-dependent haloperoxidase n=1 Tax=Westerdykella ornata TaxID=318751 RepID=A0A6A6JIP6_WESOR|nr:acid phosphatase/Vanadium-dependent haloperoxidase [Westerdykella ornata]KAF2276095.1 acid phosphatase/Vanadium-dependent haloperoxidase [Westerdykella ornata]
MRSLNFALPSKRLIFSYIFDWIVIIAIAAVGAAWDGITPFHRPFSLVDLSISYPFETKETIPTWLLVVVSLVIPAAITFIVCLVFVPGPTARKGTPLSLIWRRKVWEWNTAWMGLGMSLATAFMVTQGMKLLFGKPRPDLLSRCQADRSRIAQTDVGGYAESFNALWVLVTSDVCTQTNDDILQDGFKSFPSGHASFSWAGLLYLTLFLASKFAVAIPFLPPRPFSTNPDYTSAVAPSNLKQKGILPTHNKARTESGLSSPGYAEDHVVPIRYQAAAPPVWTLVLVLVPIGAAIYITSTRFTDYRHHGWDLIFGSLLGITTAWFSFRWYHLPITRGAGWAWGPRSYKRSWGIGVGVGSYVGTEGWSHRGESKKAERGPLEGNGIPQDGIAENEAHPQEYRAHGANAV